MRDDNANQWNNLNFEDLTHRIRLQVDDLIIQQATLNLSLIHLLNDSLTHPLIRTHSIYGCCNNVQTAIPRFVSCGAICTNKTTQGHPCQWGYDIQSPY